jgi:hypothetical protein
MSCLQGREKINLIYSFTKMGFDVLLSDVDTVWLRNPLPYMKQVGRDREGKGHLGMLSKGQSSFGLAAKWGQVSEVGRGKVQPYQHLHTHSNTPIYMPLPRVFAACPALQYPEADILTSSDHLINTNGASEGLEKWPEAASAANIGIMLFRPKGHDLAAVGLSGCC